MAVAYIHADSSVKRWGGTREDYLEIHKKMDCSKGYFPDNRHRALTHHHFWINEVMIPLFGDSIINSDDKEVSVKLICELHCLEDFHMRFIPSAQDFLEAMNEEPWMNNGMGNTPSSAILRNKIKNQ